MGWRGVRGARGGGMERGVWCRFVWVRVGGVGS